MGMRWVELTDGSEYACNEESRGLFHRRQDGTWGQFAGTGQTPKFRNAAHMMRYARDHYSNPDADDGSYPAIKRGSASGWPAPGRPVSTGSDSTEPIRFRVSTAQRAELAAEARRLGLATGDSDGAGLAAKRRAFPATAT